MAIPWRRAKSQERTTIISEATTAENATSSFPFRKIYVCNHFRSFNFSFAFCNFATFDFALSKIFYVTLFARHNFRLDSALFVLLTVTVAVVVAVIVIIVVLCCFV